MSTERSGCVVLVVFIVVASVASASAQPAVRDGNWWRKFDALGSRGDVVKLAYATGVLDGGVIRSGLDLATKNTPTDSLGLNMNAQQLVDGLNHLFADFRNRSVEIRFATVIVFRQIAGSPQAEIDSMIEQGRREGSSRR